MAPDSTDRLDVGTRVELHSRFTDTWEGGFVVDEVLPDAYRVRRRSDGSLLPWPTGLADIRPERRSTWHDR